MGVMAEWPPYIPTKEVRWPAGIKEEKDLISASQHRLLRAAHYVLRRASSGGSDPCVAACSATRYVLTTHVRHSRKCLGRQRLWSRFRMDPVDFAVRLVH